MFGIRATSVLGIRATSVFGIRATSVFGIRATSVFGILAKVRGWWLNTFANPHSIRPSPLPTLVPFSPSSFPTLIPPPLSPLPTLIPSPLHLCLPSSHLLFTVADPHSIPVQWVTSHQFPFGGMFSLPHPTNFPCGEYDFTPGFPG